MAFGTKKGNLSVAANSITNPIVATGSVAVVVDDLIYVVVGQQTNLTAGAVTDNLGNVYAACNAGSDPGDVTGRAYYSRVTVAGTLTAISVVATASALNAVVLAAVYEGPFMAPPIDANPANTTGTVASPASGPATGVLTQAEELVVSWGVSNSIAAFTAVAPNVEGGELASEAVLNVALGAQVVAATSSIAPAWTIAPLLDFSTPRNDQYFPLLFRGL